MQPIVCPICQSPVEHDHTCPNQLDHIRQLYDDPEFVAMTEWQYHYEVACAGLKEANFSRYLWQWASSEVRGLSNPEIRQQDMQYEINYIDSLMGAN